MVTKRSEYLVPARQQTLTVAGAKPKHHVSNPAGACSQPQNSPTKERQLSPKNEGNINNHHPQQLSRTAASPSQDLISITLPAPNHDHLLSSRSQNPLLRLRLQPLPHPNALPLPLLPPAQPPPRHPPRPRMVYRRAGLRQHPALRGEGGGRVAVCDGSEG